MIGILRGMRRATSEEILSDVFAIRPEQKTAEGDTKPDKAEKNLIRTMLEEQIRRRFEMSKNSVAD